MEKISNKELEKILLQNNGKTFYISLKGIITTNMKIENTQTSYDKENNLIIQNSKKEEEKIKLNTHQFMKIEKDKINKVNIQFDQLESMEISIISNE